MFPSGEYGKLFEWIGYDKLIDQQPQMFRFLNTAMRPLGITLATMAFFLATACDDGVVPPPLPMYDAGVSSVEITSPANGALISLNSDQDNDLENGFQLEVVVRATNALNDNVQLRIDNQEPVVNQLMAGETTFVVTLDPGAAPDHEISAVIGTASGMPMTDTINFRLEATDCSLQVQPQPLGAGCDLGADSDLDPSRPGLQTMLTALTDCDQASFVVNGLPGITVSVVNGEANAEVTLRDGQNSIEVTATNNGSSPGVIGPYPLFVRTAPPGIFIDELRSNRTNQFLLADAEQQANQFFWTVEGSVTGIAPGQAVSVVTEPEFDGVPQTVQVNPDGSFNFEVGLDEGSFYEGSLTIRGSDDCGTTGESESYDLYVDAVTPNLSIGAPADGRLLTLADDEDEDREGVQVSVQLVVEDDRPASTEYGVGVECTTDGVDFEARSQLIPRSDLLDADELNDVVEVEFSTLERGAITCRLFTDAVVTNPAVVEETEWSLFFARPTLQVVSPTPEQGCASDDAIRVSAVGQDLDGNEPSLSLVVVPDGEPALPAVLMTPVDGEAESYEYVFDAPQLAEGTYTFQLSAEVVGGVAVEVSPAEWTVVVDRTAPTVAIINPGQDELFIDEDVAQPGVQSTVQLQVCGAAGRLVAVSSEPPVDGSPFIVQLPEDEDCSEVALPTTTMPIGSVAFSASVTDSCGFEGLAQATGSFDPLFRYESPTETINTLADDDAAAAGCQIEVVATVRGFGQNAEFAVCSGNVGGGAVSALCEPGEFNIVSGDCRFINSVAEGWTVGCPVSVVDGEYSLRMVGRNGGSLVSVSPVVNFDCTVPTVNAFTVVEDADGNGCVHQQERSNAEEAAGSAQVSIGFQTTGIEDGLQLSLYAEDGTRMGLATVNAGQGSVDVSLSDGTRRFFVRGQDRAGNQLPTDAADILYGQILVDTHAPDPTMLNLNGGECLNATRDADGGQAGLQYSVLAETGGDLGETLTAELWVDGVLTESVEDAGQQYAFAQASLDDGSHQVAVTVSDACGNMGSAQGFAAIGNLPDWTSPIALQLQTDTVAPVIRLEGIPGDAQTVDDDADDDPSTGFQLDIAVGMNPLDTLEAGQSIEIFANGVPANTSPAPVVVPENVAGPIGVRLTLPPGIQGLSARAEDVCGNVTQTAETDVEVAIPGCASRVLNFPSNPAVLSGADGNAGAGDLTLNIDGQVDLFEPACVGADARLVIDGVAGAPVPVPAGGLITFSGEVLPEGQHDVSIRVGPVANATTDSPVQRLVVDVTTPTISISSPAAGEAVLTDSNAGLDGQQATIEVQVTEAPATTDRLVTLRIDGANIATQDLDSDAGGLVRFLDVTVTPGIRVVEVCVNDQANNSTCTSRDVNFDPAAPGTVGAIAVNIINPRESRIELSFTAPGDDGAAGGRVTDYELRSASVAIANENDWDIAADTAMIWPSEVDPGAEATVTIAGPGPGPALAGGLRLNAVHQVAIRARDEEGRLGPIVNAEVDLSLTMNTFSISARSGAWADGGGVNTTSSVIGLGDVNGDGLSDVLVSIIQGPPNGTYQAGIVLGNADPDQAVFTPLDLPPNTFDGYYGFSAVALDDVNGDGFRDFAVQGYNAAFGVSIGIYFGCEGAACDANALASPDAQITSSGFADRTANMMASVGNSIFVGGGAPTDTTAFLVVGGANAWPALPASVVISNDPANLSANVQVITAPVGPAGVYASGVGDVDGDGNQDLVFSAGGDINRSFLLYGGRFERVELANPCGAGNASFGSFFTGGVDLDGTAGPDFVVVNRNNKRVVVFNQDLASTDCFGRPPSQFGHIVDLAGDFNGDGFEDLIVTHGDDDPGKVEAYVFYNDGQGQFGVNDPNSSDPEIRVAEVLLGSPALRKLGVAGIGDFDNDNRPDVAAIVRQPDNFELIIYR